MKKLGIIALTLVLTVALCACGRSKAPTDTTVDTTHVTTAPTTEQVAPTTMPTMDTNIPDPEIDTGIGDTTDETHGTESSGTTDTTGQARSRGRNGGR